MYEIETREQPEQTTAVVRGTVERDRAASWLSATYGTVVTHLQRIGVATAGPPFARFGDDDGSSAPVEAGIPVVEVVDRKDEVEPSSLPGGLVAVAWHRGPLTEVGAAYEAIDAWVARTGVEKLGRPWEVHHHDATADDEPAWATEVVQPIREA